MKNEKTFASRLLDLIPSGEENAISTKDLANLLNCHSREITLTIHFLRVKGTVICSCTKGFFKPKNLEETRHFVATMRSRCKHIRAAAASAEKLLKMGGIEDERRRID